MEIIGEGAFANCGFSTITFPKSVKTIDKDAFAECENLQSIHFPEHSLLESVGNAAFYNCTSLENVNFEDALNFNSLGDSAFSGCENLNV